MDAQQVVTKAEGALALLDQQLGDNARQRETEKAALKEAIKSQARLRKAIKVSAKQREKLRTARKRAERNAKKARQRAKATEAKFDKSLRADMLRKHKSADLSKNSGVVVKRGAATPGEPLTTAVRTPQRRSADAKRRPRDTIAPSSRRTAAAASGHKTRT